MPEMTRRNWMHFLVVLGCAILVVVVWSAIILFIITRFAVR